MTTIARYSRLEDAQRDADRLARRGIGVTIVHGGSGAIIPGTGTWYELQVHPRDLVKLDELEEEVREELRDERPYECPACRSENYGARTSFADLNSLLSPLVLGVFGMLKKARAAPFDSDLRFKCEDCGAYFTVRMEP